MVNLQHSTYTEKHTFVPNPTLSDIDKKEKWTTGALTIVHVATNLLQATITEFFVLKLERSWTRSGPLNRRRSSCFRNASYMTVEHKEASGLLRTLFAEFDAGLEDLQERFVGEVERPGKKARFVEAQEGYVEREIK
jgi:hypothetical protein